MCNQEVETWYNDNFTICNNCNVDLDMAWYPETTATYDANVWYEDNLVTIAEHALRNENKPVNHYPPMWDDDDDYDIEEQINNQLKDYIMSSDGELTEYEIQEYRDMLTSLAYDDDSSLDDPHGYASDFSELDLGLSLTETGKPFFKNLFNIDAELTVDSLMCCDLEPSQCTCEHKNQSMIYSRFQGSRSFMSVYNFLQQEVTDFEELTEWVYDQDDYSGTVLCELCVHHGTYKCLPLRNWMRWLTDEAYNLTLPLPLDHSYATVSPCESFVAKSSVSGDTIDYVKQYIEDHNGITKKEDENPEEYIPLEEFVNKK